MKLLKFYRENCAPCKMLDLVLKDIHQEFYPVDVEKNPDLTAQFNVVTVPTLIKITKDGVTSKEGFISKEDTIKWLQE